eukprot:4752640-Pleurochrysis_carterae.AAC.1
MQFRVEAVQVAVAWPSRVLQASTLLSSLDAAVPDNIRSSVPFHIVSFSSLLRIPRLPWPLSGRR